MPRGKKAAAATTTPQSQTVTPFDHDPSSVNGGSSSSPFPNGHPVAAVNDVGGEQSTEDATPGGMISALIQKQMDTEGIEQFELPRAVITRVAKNAVSTGSGYCEASDKGSSDHEPHLPLATGQCSNT